MTCADENLRLVPNFGADGVNIEWTCLPDEDHICDGEFKVFCPGAPDEVPEEGLEPGIDEDERCTCDGQVFVTPDCKHADRCRRLGGGDLTGGDGQFVVREEIDCGDGDETIVFDFFSFEPTCEANVDNCPNQGGFALGCTVGAIPIPEDPRCEYTTKDFTTDISCDCDNQVRKK